MRWFIALPLTLLGLTGAIGALHLPAAKPVLMALAPALGVLGYDCPVRASPEEVEVARLTSARAARGVERSPERPALGFDLDRMTRADVDVWAKEHGVTCVESQKGTVLRCTEVAAKAIGQVGTAIDDLSFAFEPAGMRLVTVTSLRNQLDAKTASSTMRAVAEHLEIRLGKGRALGSSDAAVLAEAPLRTALVEYRFSDYIANVSATNLGGRVAVREHYMSAVD